MHFNPKGFGHVLTIVVYVQLANIVFYITTILLKIVVFFNLLGHYMSAYVLLPIASIML